VSDIFVIIIGASLVNNLIIDYLLGVPSAIAVSKKIETAISMAITMTIILTIASAVSYPIKLYLIEPNDLAYLSNLVLILIITLLILLGDRLIQKFWPQTYKEITVFIPLTLVNTSVLGIALLEIQQNHSFFESIIFGLGSGLGFGLVLILFTSMDERNINADIPVAFQGLAINLITLAIVSMAFMGFTGLVTL
jgi:electron transport complex protein RnfA